MIGMAPRSRVSSRRGNSPPSTEKGRHSMEAATGVTGTLIKALAFAADKHRNQRRKDADASPYINHPIALANVLANEGGVEDPVVLSAALLHDTVEDTETTPAELEAQFGGKVAAVVLEGTD